MLLSRSYARTIALLAMASREDFYLVQDGVHIAHSPATGSVTVRRAVPPYAAEEYASLQEFINAYGVMGFHLERFCDKLKLADWHQQAALVCSSHAVHGGTPSHIAAAQYHQSRALELYKNARD